MLTRQDGEYKALIVRFLNMIGELAQTPEDVEKAHLLLATWKDVFVENIGDMLGLDLFEHRILQLPLRIPIHHQQSRVPRKFKIRSTGPSEA